MSALSTLASQFAQHEFTKFSIARKREVAKRAERKKIDKIHSGKRITKKKSTLSTSGQKAASRRKGFMKKVAPAGSGYQRLMKTLGE